MNNISLNAKRGSSLRGWIQSTGQTSTHAVSFVPTHGSQMTYAILPVSSYENRPFSKNVLVRPEECQRRGLSLPCPFSLDICAPRAATFSARVAVRFPLQNVVHAALPARR